MAYLTEKYPTHQFSLIIGSDNLETLHKWKNYQVLLKSYSFIVYPRYGYKGSQYDKLPNVTVVKAPEMNLSSTMIRQAIKDKKDIRFLMPAASWKYLREMHFYE
jgi:nicotinate-nucleotide adenylyltransferase